MPLPRSDRTLRRMVADLAAMDEEDAAAVLAELTASERQTIESLLREFVGEVEPAPPPTVKECDYAQLSPWLAERARAPQDSAMTPEAHRVLHDCAVALFPAPEDSRPGPGLFARAASRAISIISLGGVS